MIAQMDACALHIAKFLEILFPIRVLITTLNEVYIKDGSLGCELMGRGYAWLDTGTHQSLLQAGQFVATIEERQNLKVGSPEEVAYRMGFIGAEDLLEIARDIGRNSYGTYMRSVVRND